MTRRLWVPAWVLATFFSISMVAAGLSASFAQDAPAQDAPAQDAPAQETPAQDAPAQAPETPAVTDAQPTAQPAGDPAQAQAAFEAKFNEWKDLIKKLRTLKHDYQEADEAGRAQMEEQWAATMAEANNMVQPLTDAALAAYMAAPNEDRELTNFLVKRLQDLVTTDQYEAAVALGNGLVDAKCDSPQIYREAGIANYATNNYDRAIEILEKAEALSSISADGRGLRKVAEEYKEHWKVESALREKEAAADDLPRVKLTTSKGEIVLELFENEAPDTVGNFISLVKSGFYDGLTFHRVIGGFMAQGGCPEGDGTGGPGYSIYDECEKPEARKHFRGSLSMAKTQAPNSGGSQFFLCFRPASDLNGKHTVFGRVIEGLDVLSKIQRRDPNSKDLPEPDTIVKAEVLRDRGHEYKPNKVQ